VRAAFFFVTRFTTAFLRVVARFFLAAGRARAFAGFFFRGAGVRIADLTRFTSAAVGGIDDTSVIGSLISSLRTLTIWSIVLSGFFGVATDPSLVFATATIGNIPVRVN